MGSAFVNELGLPVHRLPLTELATFLPMVFEVSVDLLRLVASVCYGTTTSNTAVSPLPKAPPLRSYMKTKDELGHPKLISIFASARAPNPRDLPRRRIIGY